MGKLIEILEKGKMPSVDGRLYDWTQLYGLTAIVEFDAARTKVGPVNVNSADHISQYGETSNSPWSDYGDRLQYIEEALLYSDGSILLAASVSSWLGTFASHDGISIKYYALSPIAKKAAARRERRIKKTK